MTAADDQRVERTVELLRRMYRRHLDQSVETDQEVPHAS